ncbi:hypothetical protein DYB32_000535 [Aphanomyces invadans]|uniref:Uncharacterized protein n=1 Tax=Aphanomyces invadans TaxID=157072 RepID=A0A3R6VTV3_9STRA|nr:hypothetical protein DYB32_000535 [Aphanomyces invadans]
MKPQKGGAKKGGGKPKSKLVVTFDADKRKYGASVASLEYLTGFHKRKQDRRRFGHDMEAFKKKKAQIEARKINDLLLAALAKKKDRENQKQKNHLTLFQRVQLKRKGVALPTKRSKIKAAKQNAKRNGKAHGTAGSTKKGPKKDSVDEKIDKRKGFHKARRGKHAA